jgi:hypothetical protein
MLTKKTKQNEWLVVLVGGLGPPTLPAPHEKNPSHRE